MAIDWGAWEYSGGNGMRVGIEVTWESITHSETVATATIKIYTENQFTYSDGQTLSYGGSISGSTGFTNNDGGAQILRATKTYDYTYSSSSYGSSPATKTFTASLSGAYNGVTPSNSVSSAVPARPYAAPAAPTGVSASRISDTSTKISWVGHSTSGEPWNNVFLQRSVNGAAFTTISSTIAGSATSYTHGTAANTKYRFQVAADNTVGTSAYVQTGDIYTTPAVPVITAALTDITGPPTGKRISWANTGIGFSEYSTEIIGYKNGVSVGVLGTVAAGGTTYDHLSNATSNPYTTSDKWKYTVRHKTTAGVQGTLYSAETGFTNETPGIATAPNAPTGLNPAGIVIDPSVDNQFSWTYNTTDGSGQVGYELQWRLVGAGSWTAAGGDTASGSSSKTMALGTFTDGTQIEWQVRTRGGDVGNDSDHANDWSPWSSPATVSIALTPILPDPIKVPMQLDLFTGKMEASFTANELRDYVGRAQSRLFGGGTITVDASYNVSWSARFITIGYGRSGNTFPNGHHDIINPNGWNNSLKEITSNVAKITFTTSTNRARVGDIINVGGVGAPFDGDWTVTEAGSNYVKWKLVNANIASTAATGATYCKIPGHGGAADRNVPFGKILLNSWEALYYEPPFGWGSGSTPRKNGVVAVTFKSLTSNVAKLEFNAPHYYAIGDRVTVSGVDATFNGSDLVITAMDATSISYAKTASNVTRVASGGLINPSGKDTWYSRFHVVNFTSDFVVPSNWILIAIRNGDLAQVQFSTGDDISPGYDSATYNIGGQKIKKFNVGNASFTTDTSGSKAVAHGLGATPTQVLVSPGGSGGGVRISNVGTFGATTFNVTLRNAADNTSYTTSGTTVSLYFLAISE